MKSTMEKSEMTRNLITARLNGIDEKLDLYKTTVKKMDAGVRNEGLALVARLINIRKKTARELERYSNTSGIPMENAGLKLQESLRELSAELGEAGRILDSGNHEI